MAIASSSDLMVVLRQHHLVEPAHLAEMTGLVKSFPEPRTLASELLRRGWLTSFQVEQIFLDKSHELTMGSYVLLEQLGDGGRAFKAKNRKLGQVFALKLIGQEKLGQPMARQRYQSAVHAVVQLNHPNIVRTFSADDSDGIPILAMEYLGSIDLARLVKERGPLPVDLACDYLRQAALGLQHAFERGILHRDIKPSNLLVTSSYTPVVGGLRQDDPPTALGARLPAPEPLPGFRPRGIAKILNMGLALVKLIAGDQGNSPLVGTPDYLAPEQTLTARPDIRADLYSLGCTFYFMLTGQVPFPEGDAEQKLHNHREMEPEPVAKLRPEVPPWVVEVVHKLMAKKPEDRYQTPAEVAAVLASGNERVPNADGQVVPANDGENAANTTCPCSSPTRLA